ncbi:MAG: N-acetylneuraminate synthase family protein [Candidatus Kapaibacterium sp.]
MLERKVKIADKYVGDGHPVFVVAEIGINHNGSIDLAKKMIAGAAAAGADAVKFQKRTPELCVPRDQWDLERDTPWGRMKYIDYRYKVEFGEKEYSELEKFCRDNNILWTASCWDEPSVDFIHKFDIKFHKAPSAALTDLTLLSKMKASGLPLMISSGMSEMREIEQAIDVLGRDNLLLAHSTSTYPCKLDELNLRVIVTLKEKYPDIPIGYSGHETGLAPTWSAVTLGANFIERHVTLDRAMWGTDQAASVEIGGLIRLVSNIRDIEVAMGDGIKKVYDSELPVRKKLRKVV